MPSRESREGIRIRDRILMIHNNSRIFAFGEDSLALRLASELADLRAANANQHTRKRVPGSYRAATPANKAKSTAPKTGWCFLL